MKDSRKNKGNLKLKFGRLLFLKKKNSENSIILKNDVVSDDQKKKNLKNNDLPLLFHNLSFSKSNAYFPNEYQKRKKNNSIILQLTKSSLNTQKLFNDNQNIAQPRRKLYPVRVENDAYGFGNKRFNFSHSLKLYNKYNNKSSNSTNINMISARHYRHGNSAQRGYYNSINRTSSQVVKNYFNTLKESHILREQPYNKLIDWFWIAQKVQKEFKTNNKINHFDLTRVPDLEMFAARLRPFLPKTLLQGRLPFKYEGIGIWC